MYIDDTIYPHMRHLYEIVTWLMKNSPDVSNYTGREPYKRLKWGSTEIDLRGDRLNTVSIKVGSVYPKTEVYQATVPNDGVYVSVFREGTWIDDVYDAYHDAIAYVRKTMAGNKVRSFGPLDDEIGVSE